MIRQKTFTDYKKSGFRGNDVSLEISLYEYGLIWKLRDRTTMTYSFIFGIGTDSKGNYNLFGDGDISKEGFKYMINGSWFNRKNFSTFIGSDKIDFPNDVSSIVHYYGYLNVFGDCYGYNIPYR